MVRTAVPVTLAPGSAATTRTLVGPAGALQAADTVNFNSAPLTGREILLVQNTAGGAGTVTITSKPDPYGRLGDITADSIAAALFGVYGPFDLNAWKQADGNLYFQASAVTMLFAWIRFS